MRAACLVAAIAAVVGCVNNYVVREPDDEDATTSECPMDSCGQGDTAADDGAGTFECIPCESDRDCGDEWDHCVPLDVIGLHCTTACPEAGCPAGSVCRNALSVDHVEAMQCLPRMPTCAGDE
ncbi:MAG TPA: hypothetical protein VFG69_11420 [Nannocystaceae bacterium]|nr:hypothetical protein [Nannocystaceae bacterium]